MSQLLIMSNNYCEGDWVCVCIDLNEAIRVQ